MNGQSLPTSFYIERLVHKLVINSKDKSISKYCFNEIVHIALKFKEAYGAERYDDYKLSFEDYLLCSHCWRIDRDIISPPCGHICCRKCFDDCDHNQCTVCLAYFGEFRSLAKSNYKLNNLIGEVFNLGVEFEIRRENANKKLRQKKYFDAISDYTELLGNRFCEHLILSNRCYAYMLVQKYELALRDSLLLLKMAWGWKKAHFRQAMIYKRLNEPILTLEALMNALILDPKDSLIKTELQNMLDQLLSSEYISEIRRKCMVFNYLKRDSLTASMLQMIYKSQNKQYDETLRYLFEHPIYSRKMLPTIKSESNLNQTNSENDGQNTSQSTSLDLEMSVSKQNKPFDIENLRKKISIEDFECALCMKIFINPLALICGHTFCQHCLQRSLDYKSCCPLCKCDLSKYFHSLEMTTSTNIKRILDVLWPLEVAEYQTSYTKELLYLTKSSNHCPFMVCTVAFPGVQCKLHIFEPRYQLMLRRALEVGKGKFGMVFGSNGPREVGTMLDINRVELLDDGRYNVSAVALPQRIKLIKLETVDGYLFAEIKQYFDVYDCPIDDLNELSASVYDKAMIWYRKLPRHQKDAIIFYYGPFPSLQKYKEHPVIPLVSQSDTLMVNENGLLDNSNIRRRSSLNLALQRRQRGYKRKRITTSKLKIMCQ